MAKSSASDIPGTGSGEMDRKVEVITKGNRDWLVITMPLVEPRASTSGKTLTVAYLRTDPQDPECPTHRNKPLTVQVNAFIKK